MESLSWAGGGRWMLKMSSRRDPVLLQVGISCRRGCAPICTCTPSPEMRCSQTKLRGVWGFCAGGPLARRAAWPGRAPGGCSCLPTMFSWFVGTSQKTGLPSVCELKGGWPRVCLSNGQKLVFFVLCLTRPPEILHVQPPLPLFLSFHSKFSLVLWVGVSPLYSFRKI